MCARTPKDAAEHCCNCVKVDVPEAIKDARIEIIELRTKAKRARKDGGDVILINMERDRKIEAVHEDLSQMMSDSEHMDDVRKGCPGFWRLNIGDEALIRNNDRASEEKRHFLNKWNSSNPHSTVLSNTSHAHLEEEEDEERGKLGFHCKSYEHSYRVKLRRDAARLAAYRAYVETGFYFRFWSDHLAWNCSKTPNIFIFAASKENLMKMLEGSGDIFFPTVTKFPLVKSTKYSKLWFIDENGKCVMAKDWVWNGIDKFVEFEKDMKVHLVFKILDAIDKFEVDDADLMDALAGSKPYSMGDWVLLFLKGRGRDVRTEKDKIEEELDADTYLPEEMNEENISKSVFEEIEEQRIKIMEEREEILKKANEMRDNYIAEEKV